MYKTNPYINKVYEFDDSLKRNIEELKIEHYDYVVDLQKNKRSVRVTRALGRPHALKSTSCQIFISSIDISRLLRN